MFANSNRVVPVLTNSRFDFGVGQMDRLFDQLFDGLHAGAQADGWSSPWAWWEDGGHVYLELEMPGVKTGDLELVAHEGKLTIKGKKSATEGDRKYRHNNRRYGQFERAIVLPETVDAENVTAELRDGVLYITLAKLPKAQPKRITVQIG
jgi:HSP20 family protein